MDMLELPVKQSNTSVQEQTLENHAKNDTQPHFSDGKYTKAPIIQQQHASSINNGLIKRKLLLLSPLLICLYVLTDTTHHNLPNNNYNDTRQHLAFITALSRHPPALRVFRIVSESAFLLFCTAFALWAWEACDSSSVQNHPNNRNDASLQRQFSRSISILVNYYNNNDDNEQTTTTIRIPSQTVGKLLFAPPPKPITDSTAWRVYKKHHHRLVFRRGKERSSSSSLKTGRDRMRDEEQNDLLEVSNQQHKSEEDEKDLDILPLIEHQSVQQDSVDDRRGDNDDDDYIENKENGIRNDTHVLFTEETTSSSLPPPKPPSSNSVLGAALDITTVMCIFLIFFTISSAEGGRYIDHKARGTININPSSNHIQDNLNNETTAEEEHDDNNEISYMKFFAKIAAPLFPITLFLLSIFLLIIPWKKRKVLWTIVSLTLGAPYYEVTFRDGFVGDILTSAVRPLQDLAYTVVFLGVGLQSWWAQAYFNNNSGTTAANGDTSSSSSLDDVPLERSWLLHTLILPACTLSPLWWRFLQNLRQCFDAKQRWPYLGNAFKYMLAAEVAIFGMFDPSVKKHPVWIMCFFVATLYQVWWDVFMDWGLLEWDEDTVTFAYYHSNGGGDGRRGLFWWWPYKLRSRRAYPHRWMYYTIFIINFCLRFVGMLTLIPPVYLSRRTGLIVNTWYDPDFQLFVGSMAASAEIFRRTIWALLRLEWEVIKTSPPVQVQPLMAEKSEEGGEDDDLLDLLGEETDMKPMAISSSSLSDGDRGGRFGFSISNVRSSRISLASLSDMSNLNGIQILSELCAWATIFSGIAIIAAAHREVL